MNAIQTEAFRGTQEITCWARCQAGSLHVCLQLVGAPAVMTVLCRRHKPSSASHPQLPTIVWQPLCRASHLHAACPLDHIPQRKVTSDVQTGISCSHLDSLHGCCYSCVPAAHSTYRLFRSAADLHVQPQQCCLPLLQGPWTPLDLFLGAESSAQQLRQEEHVRQVCWPVRCAQFLINECQRDTWPVNPAAGTPALQANPMPVANRTLHPSDLTALRPFQMQ